MQCHPDVSRLLTAWRHSVQRNLSVCVCVCVHCQSFSLAVFIMMPHKLCNVNQRIVLCHLSGVKWLQLMPSETSLSFSASPRWAQQQGLKFSHGSSNILSSLNSSSSLVQNDITSFTMMPSSTSHSFPACLRRVSNDISVWP